MSATQPPLVRRGLERWAGLGAVAYVVLFIAGTLLAYGGQPDTGGPPGKLVAYYSDAGHRDKVLWGWFLAVIGVFFLIWFLGALRRTLSRIDTDGTLTTVATAGGAVYAALTLADVSVNTAIKTMSDDTFHHQVYPSLIHAADDAGYVLHSSGGAGAAALIVAASVLAGRAGRIPRWAGVLGVIVGVLAIFSIFFLPQWLIALWLLAAGVLLFRAPETAPGAAVVGRD
jgi:hypothetical protein